jgi:hypothetical protein
MSAAPYVKINEGNAKRECYIRARCTISSKIRIKAQNLVDQHAPGEVHHHHAGAVHLGVHVCALAEVDEEEGVDALG